MVKSSLDRVISFFTALMMIFTLLPAINVYADDEPPAAPAVPVIKSVSTDDYAEYETQTVKIVGENLDAITKIAIGSTDYTETKKASSDGLTFVIDPAKPAGTYTVTFTYLKGTANATITKTFKIIKRPNDPKPIFKTVTPAFATADKEETITIKGEFLDSVETISIGSTKLDYTKTDDPAELTFKFPANKAGTYTLTFGYYNKQTVTQTFKVYAEGALPVPSITSITPASFLENTDQTIIITGKNLDAVEAVTIGGKEYGIDTQAATKIVLEETSFTKGDYEVAVKYGSTTALWSKKIAVTEAPDVKAIDPEYGIASTSQPITVTGVGLTNVTKVTLTPAAGGAAANCTIKSKSDEELVFTLPSKTAGDYIITFDGSNEQNFKIKGAPSISASDPAKIPENEETKVTLTGKNLEVIKSVSIGSAVFEDFEPIEDEDGATQLEFTFPPKAKGTYTLTFSYGAGKSISKTFTVVASSTLAASVTSVSPTSFLEGAEQIITITGKNLDLVKEVTIGSTKIEKDSENMLAQSATSIKVGVTLTANGSPYDVSLTYLKGSSDTLLNNVAVIYVAAAPEIENDAEKSLSPSFGTANVSEPITVTGKGLGTITKVTMKIDGGASTNCTIKSKSDAELVFTLPAKAAGTYSFDFEYGGTSPVTVEGFVVKAAPVIDSLTPAKLADDAAEQKITVEGSNLGSITKAAIGSEEFEIEGLSEDEQSFTFTIDPPKAKGTYTVVFTYSGGKTISKTITVTSADDLKPAVTSVAPASFLVGTEQTITITGKNLDTVTTVTIGGQSRAIASQSATKIVLDPLTLPAGDHAVVLLYPDPKAEGSDASVTSSTKIKVAAIPTLDADEPISPEFGIANASQPITVKGTGLTAITKITMKIDGGTSTNCTIKSKNEEGTELVFTLPSKPKGTYSFELDYGGENTLEISSFDIKSKPIIAVMTPAKAAEKAEQKVKLTGSDLDTITAIKIGSTPCVISEDGTAGEIEFTIPEGMTKGTYTITFTYGDGLYLSKTFSFVAAEDLLPSVTSVTPNSFLEGTSQTITITGKNLDIVTAVTIGEEVTIANKTSTKIVLAPVTLDAEGSPYDVELAYTVGEDQDGTVTAATKIKVLAIPELDKDDPIDPKFGIANASQTMTVKGTGLESITKVTLKIDGGVSTSCTINSKADAKLVFTLPSKPAGTYSFEFEYGGETPLTIDKFEIKGAPVIEDMTPVKGEADKAVDVTVTGKNLDVITSITIGSETIWSAEDAEAAAAAEDAAPGTELKFTMPGKAKGTYTLSFNYGIGKSITKTFTFVDPADLIPTITSVTPEAFMAGTPQTITVTGKKLDNITKIMVEGAGEVTPTTHTTTKIVFAIDGLDAGKHVIIFTYGTEDDPQTNEDFALTATGKPEIKELSPEVGVAKMAQPITAIGANLQSISKITVDGTNCSIVSKSEDGSELVFTFPYKTKGSYEIEFDYGGEETIKKTLVVDDIPVITDFTPLAGVKGETVEITFNGSNLKAISKITLKNNDITNDCEIEDGTIKYELTTPEAGSYVFVFTYGGSKTISKTFTVKDAPEVTGISPDKGIAGVQYKITASGTNLLGVASIAVGSETINPANITKHTDTAIEFILPAQSTDATISFKYGASGKDDKTFTVSPAPSFDTNTFVPKSGTTGTNYKVTVTGKNLDGIDKVTVDRKINCAITRNSDEEIVITVPSQPVGNYPIVFTYGGTGAAPAADVAYTFYFNPAPEVGNLNYTTGIVGLIYELEVDGSNLDDITKVEIDGDDITKSATISESSIKFDFKGDAVRKYTINFTYGEAPNETTVSKEFNVIAAPTVTSIAPAEGVGGATYEVTAKGTGLTYITAVKVGDSTIATIGPKSAGELKFTFDAPTAANEYGVTFTYISDGAKDPGTITGLKFTVKASPTVDTLAPDFAIEKVAQAITVSGTNLTGVTAVTAAPKEGGAEVNCQINNKDDNALTFTTPQTLTAGVYTISFKYGSAAQTKDLTVKPTPVVNDITPTTGIVGLEYTIKVNGANMSGLDSITVNGANIAEAPFNDTSIDCTFTGTTATTYNVTFTYGGTAKKTITKPFRTTAAPNVTSLTPAEGVQGKEYTVTAKGTNLTSVEKIVIGTTEIAKAAFENLSATEIKFTFTAPAATGPVNIEFVYGDTAGGAKATGSVVRTFNVKGVPTVKSLDPAAGIEGISYAVTANGSDLSSVTAVTIALKDGSGSTTNCTINSKTDEAIKFTIPAGLTAGDYTITFDYGADKTSAEFKFNDAPEVTEVTPDSVITGLEYKLTVKGTDLNAIESIKAGTKTITTFESQTKDQIEFKVTLTGNTTLEFNYGGGKGKVTKAVTVRPAPTVSKITPANGVMGVTYTVTAAGTNMDDITEVTVGGTKATIVEADRTPTEIKVTFTVPNEVKTHDVIFSYGEAGIVTTPGTIKLSFKATERPGVIEISPKSGLEDVDRNVVAKGTELDSVNSITINGVECTINKRTNTQIDFTVPGQPAKEYDIEFNYGGADPVKAKFTFLEMPDAPPTIELMDPVKGLYGEPANITITGKNLYGVTAVHIGSTYYEIDEDSRTETTISFTIPSPAASTKDTTLTLTLDYTYKKPGEDKTTSGTLSQTYKFGNPPEDPKPTITIKSSLTQAEAAEDIVITGTNLAGIKEISIGSRIIPFTYNADDDTITFNLGSTAKTTYTLTFKYNMWKTKPDSVTATVKVV